MLYNKYCTPGGVIDSEYYTPIVRHFTTPDLSDCRPRDRIRYQNFIYGLITLYTAHAAF
jgi:hypothetical protein